MPSDKPYWEKYQKLPAVRELIHIPHRRFSIKRLLVLRSIINRHKIDLIHSHGKGGGIFGRILSIITGVKCLHTYHGIHIGEYNFIFRTIYLIIERLLAKFTSAFIAVSPGEHNIIAELSMTNIKKVHIIENGIEIPAQRVKNPFLSKHNLNVLIVSRFNFQKNTELVIPIMKRLAYRERLKNFTFHFIGSGAGKFKIERLMTENKFVSATHFHGDVNDITELFQKGFCYLSTSRWEGLPLAVLEALSFGIPVIATDVVGNSDIVEHGKNGYLYDIGFPEKAADYMWELFENRIRWTKFSQYIVTNFSSSYHALTMAESTERLYAKVLS